MEINDGERENVNMMTNEVLMNNMHVSRPDSCVFIRQSIIHIKSANFDISVFEKLPKCSDPIQRNTT